MIRVDLKRHGEPKGQRFALVGTAPCYITVRAPWSALLKRALTWPKGTVITLAATDEETGCTMFLRGRVK
jgi:hypothetical protein